MILHFMTQKLGPGTALPHHGGCGEDECGTCSCHHQDTTTGVNPGISGWKPAYCVLRFQCGHKKG